MKSALLVLSACLTLGVALAQEEPGMPEELQTEAKISLKVDDGPSASDMCYSFLRSKGWHEGPNKKDGGEIFIAIGTGVIMARPDSTEYIDARAAAFDAAFLGAQAKMVEYMEQNMESTTSITTIMNKGQKKVSPLDALAEARANQAALVEATDKNLFQKTWMWAHAYVDRKLREEGIDPAAEIAKGDAAVKALEAKIATIKGHAEYKKMRHSFASCAIAGMQALFTAETQDNGKGQIAVVAVWSDRLGMMAASVIHHTPVEILTPKVPIIQQVPDKDTEEGLTQLLATFGVQQKIDENGNLVLVSFAQKGCDDDNDQMLIDAVKADVQNAAAIQLREFAEASVLSDHAATDLSGQTSYGTPIPDYTNSSTVVDFKERVAEAKPLNGVSQIYPWRARHPVSKRVVYGSVCTWSPVSAQHALGMKQKMKAVTSGNVPAVPSSGSGVGTSGSSQTPPKPVKYWNVGAAGDDDAF